MPYNRIHHIDPINIGLKKYDRNEGVQQTEEKSLSTRTHAQELTTEWATTEGKMSPSSSPPFRIVPVRTDSDIEAVRHLFEQYALELNLDLSFQSFTDELASLPGKYSVDRGGEMLLARRLVGDDEDQRQQRPQQHRDVLNHQAGDVSTGEKGQQNTEGEGIIPGEVLGCVALRSLSHSTHRVENDNDKEHEDKITPKVAEMKRLYTVPSARGLGLGHALAKSIIDAAENLGYDEIKLDTLPSMRGAQRLYENFGFVDVDAYCFNPVEGTRYMGCKLKATDAAGEKS